MLRPGEGELTAAQRLLPRVVQSYDRLFDAVLGDALYFNAPFFNLCLRLGKEVITVLKDEDRVLFQDAEGVFSLTTPHVWEEANQKIQAWDAEGFTSAEGGSRSPCASCVRKRSSPADIVTDRGGSRRKKLMIGSG